MFSRKNPYDLNHQEGDDENGNHKLNWRVVVHQRTEGAPKQSSAKVAVTVGQQAAKKRAGKLQRTFAIGQAKLDHPKKARVGQRTSQEDTQRPADGP